MKYAAASASSVRVANFVSVRPCFFDKDSYDNFESWKRQMLCLLHSEELAGYVNGDITPPTTTSADRELWERTDWLVQGWILGSLGHNSLRALVNYVENPTAREFWLHLEAEFQYRIKHRPGRSFLDEPMRLPKMSAVSSVNVANFVTVKACIRGEGRNNIMLWKRQMLCLLRTQGLVDFISSDIPSAMSGSRDLQNEWGMRDDLVQSWILATIGKHALDAVSQMHTAKDIWLHLETIFNIKTPQDHFPVGVEDSHYLQVYRAAQRGDWDSLRPLFQDMKQVKDVVLSSREENAINIAIMTAGKANDFVKTLVEWESRNDLALGDLWGDCPLHYAARVGNIEAEKALVDRNPHVLYSHNRQGQLAVQVAAIYGHHHLLDYLLSKYLPGEAEEPNPFLGQQGLIILVETIGSGFLNTALDLVYKYPPLALLTADNGMSALPTLALLEHLFPTTQSFSSWWLNIVYSRIPIKKSKSASAAVRDADENYTLLQIISGVGRKVESMLWHLIAYFVAKVREVREKKARRQQALELAEYISDQIILKLPHKEALPIFKRSIFNAARRGVSVVIECVQIVLSVCKESCREQISDIFHREQLITYTVITTSNIYNQSVYIDCKHSAHTQLTKKRKTYKMRFY